MNDNRAAIELELLVLRCSREDPLAQEELVRRFEKPLFYFIRRIVQNEADAWDALQKTWLRVLAGLKGRSPPVAMKPWLYRVARNTALNHVRNESRHEANASEDLEVSGESPEFGPEDAEEVHLALDKLKLSDRETLTLHFLNELSVQEIGDVLGVPEGTIKSRLHFAKRRLREILEKRK